MKKTASIAALLVLIGIAAIAQASPALPARVPAEDVADLLATVIVFLGSFIGVLFTIVGFFALRTLVKIDRNQAKLYAWIEQLSKDFYRLEGAHNSRVSMGATCGPARPSPQPAGKQTRGGSD